MDVRSAYDTVAETYSAVIPDTSFEAPLDMAMMDHFIAHMRGTADRTVIDVGCGAGRMSSYLGQAGLNVSGVDLSPEMVRIAQQLHPGLLFELGELTDLPQADAAADGVLAWYSIIHSPRRRCRRSRASSGGRSALAVRRSSPSTPAAATARLTVPTDTTSSSGRNCTHPKRWRSGSPNKAL